MATDNAIITGGSIRPSTKNSPTDSRTRVTTKSKIAEIPLPAVGLIVYVEDEEKFYVIKGLKANSMGFADMLVDMDRVEELVPAGSGEGSGGSSSTGGLDEAAVKRICGEYHTENTFTKTVQASELTDADGDGVYEATVAHNLNTTSFDIRILDSNNSAVLEVYEIVNANSIKIYNDKAENLTVVIRK